MNIFEELDIFFGEIERREHQADLDERAVEFLARLDKLALESSPILWNFDGIFVDEKKLLGVTGVEISDHGPQPNYERYNPRGTPLREFFRPSDDPQPAPFRGIVDRFGL